MFIHSLERVNVLNVACQAYQKYIYVEFCEQINCCSLPPEGSLLESGLLLSHWCDPIAYQFSFFPQRETLSCCVNVSPFYVYVNEGGLMEPHLIMKGALPARKESQTWIRRIHLFKVQYLWEKICSGGLIRYLENNPHPFHLNRSWQPPPSPQGFCFILNFYTLLIKNTHTHSYKFLLFKIQTEHFYLALHASHQ